MISKIIRTLVTIIFALFPFWGGAMISKYTPYKEGNSLLLFILIYCGLITIAASFLFYITQHWKQFFEQPVSPGIMLFFIGCVMLGIAGLAEAPDLSLNMLRHPEREHLRYILLSCGVIFFGLYFLDLFRHDRLQFKGRQKWIFTVMVVIAMAEMIWEFLHHYLYPEGLQKWINEGHKPDDFSKHYDDRSAGTMGAIGRFVIYTIVAWLSVRLYQLQKVKLWNSILSAVFCIMGIMSAIVMFFYFNYHFQPPKSLDFLFIFFIPGIPFLLMYWIGVALLTKKPKQLTN